ncbi:MULTISPECIES: DUF6345 domain-containing protein [unclassified Archaeoglobus]|uniref:DUF6345 domain-containing protein n=1 Tax=unclassified Archaeoglobus TaxID=2643606 RepID=UPI0025C56CFB|nr:MULTISPECIES: DUF6345 domain-containing protein [unclassified Archaeoglobus]
MGTRIRITYVEDYLYSPVSQPCKASDLIPWGELEANVVENWLQNAGWSREFRHADAEVKKVDFGTQNSGYEGLDEADFHFHFGHGYKFVTGTWLALWNYSFCFNPGAIVSPGDLKKKWDFNNEWVFLHSCNVLSDVRAWGKALKYTHMIMGFSTTTYTSTDLLERFFKAAIEWDWDLYWAYYHATTETYKGYDSTIKAVIIADNSNQLYNDRLWGQRNVEPDEYPDDNEVVYREWVCSGGG